MVYVSSFRLPIHAAVRTLRGIGRIVPAMLGLVLLTAAALKTHQLAGGPVVEDSFFTSRWFLIALIESELCLGLWLLLGLYARQARLLTLACFGAFGAVSLQQALAGRASCSCFGAIALRPWYTFLFDLAAVAALWHWHPEWNICSDKGGGTGQLFTPSAFHSVRAAFPAGRHSRCQYRVASFYPGSHSLTPND